MTGRDTQRHREKGQGHRDSYVHKLAQTHGRVDVAESRKGHEEQPGVGVSAEEVGCRQIVCHMAVPAPDPHSPIPHPRSP